MELLQLRYFYDSANMGSLAKTARKHMVPASSVSAAIKRLEAELGCKVFERAANRIILNDNGRRLLRSLHVVFNELDRVVDSIATIPDDDREVWLLVKALRSDITDRVIAYKADHPNAKFRIVSDFNEDNLDAYDIIIDTTSQLYRDYARIELCSQSIGIYAASDSPLVGRRLYLRELKEYFFASMSQRGNQYRLLAEACTKVGFTPKLTAQINDVACFAKFIQSGVALGVAGERTIRAEQTADLQRLDVADFREEQTVYIYHKKNAATGSIKRFIDFIKANP